MVGVEVGLAVHPSPSPLFDSPTSVGRMYAVSYCSTEAKFDERILYGVAVFTIRVGRDHHY